MAPVPRLLLPLYYFPLRSIGVFSCIFFFIQIVFLYHGFDEFLAVCLSPLGLKG